MKRLALGILACFVMALAVCGDAPTNAQVTTIPTRHNQGTLYSMPDATAVSLAELQVPTADTGCAAVLVYIYTVTDGTDTQVHSGQVTFLARNDDGTVTADQADDDEHGLGTGCAAGCDTWSSTVSGTTATLKASFNNSLSVAGALRYGVLYDTGCTLVLK